LVKEKSVPPTWAARLKPYKLRRLYESDAQGMPEGPLLDEVGWALHARCQSFILASQARAGSVICPTCGRSLAENPRPKDMLGCQACGWACTYHALLESTKNQQLDGGPEVVELFQHYCDTFPLAKEPPQKMLLIDNLVHGFHHYLRSGRTRRPVGINLIDGHLDFVIDFLNQLAYGPASTPGTQQTYQAWRENALPPHHNKQSQKPQ
jgi:hypothetical protein